MSTQRNENESFQISIQYRILRMVLLVLVVILPAVVTVIPGVLRILYRADAQVALGHAKSVRLVLQMTGKESYGGSRSFCDASREGASQRASVHLCNPPEAISDGRWIPVTDTSLLPAADRNGSHLSSDITIPVLILLQNLFYKV